MCYRPAPIGLICVTHDDDGSKQSFRFFFFRRRILGVGRLCGRLGCRNAVGMNLFQLLVQLAQTCKKKQPKRGGKKEELLKRVARPSSSLQC